MLQSVIPRPGADTLDALMRELSATVEGEVRFDPGTRALYASDGSFYRQVPHGVVVPRHDRDVQHTVRACAAAGVALLPRGAGTSLAGQCCNEAVVMDFSRWMNRVIDIDPQRRLARVQPGCVLDDLRRAANAHGLTFGPDPSTHSHNTLGGMLGNNSCGVHSVMAGRTADNVEALEILTQDGERLRVGPTTEAELDAIIAGGGRRGQLYAGLRRLRDLHAAQVRRRYPDIPRRVSGFNLDELLPERGFNVARALAGSEGTCVTIVEASLRLVPNPARRCLVVLGFADVYRAGDAVPGILRFKPIGLEGLDDTLIQDMRIKHMQRHGRALLPGGAGWLLVEFGADSKDEAERRAQAMIEYLSQSEQGPDVQLFSDHAHIDAIWQVRESGLGATAHVPGQHESHPGWEDAAVPPQRIGDYLRAFRALLDRYHYAAALYGHFGDGCVHCRIGFDLSTDAGTAKWHAFLDEAADLVVRFGGSLSGEHGDGQARGELLEKMYGAELIDAFRQFKSLWDPARLMNPGKVVDPYPTLANLRAGPDFHPPLLETAYDYPDDHHDFARAANRCVGIGNCRQHSGGVMCPSFRATGEERYSTRGRARLLFEMLKGEPIEDGFDSAAAHDALDLCLACKGCKQDCPVGVDMATYKSEFMARHYRTRRRPRSAYAMGLIWWWSRLASTVPALANACLQTPGLSALFKRIGGIAVQRQIPRYAAQSFRDWFAARPCPNPEAPPVLLWPDTWNNHFHPALLQSATRVLEAAGFRVELPQRALCCGRPLYAEGMLGPARRQLGDILDTLAPALREGTAVVGLEPSCVSAFRDELPRLFESDPRARALQRQSLLLSEFLDRCGFVPPRIQGRAVVQLHCHHHASLDTGAERRLLEQTGLELDWLDAGCCGMAGAFGFRASSYELSRRIGELGVLPAVRKAGPGDLIISNGFSCSEQIAQETPRTAQHLAQVLDAGLRHDDTRALPWTPGPRHPQPGGELGQSN